MPCPVGPVRVRCALPAGRAVEGVDWLYPEMGAPRRLEHAAGDGAVEFEIPQVIVYGMSVLRLEAGRCRFGSGCF